MGEVGHDQQQGDALPVHGPILSIDWGTKRIGVALSDPHQTLAHPVGVLTRRTGRRFPLKQLRPLVDEYRPTGVLVGLPLEADGSEGESAAAARAAATAIRAKTQLPVLLLDERMTTARVLTAMGGTNDSRGSHTVDALAATVLLQSYLDSLRS